MNQNPPILIYQMGKVGSHTVKASLDTLTWPTAHVHFLSWSNLEAIEQHSGRSGHVEVPLHLFHGRKLRGFIDNTWGDIRWKIITLVREPVARTILDVFQNMSISIPNVRCAGEEEAVNKIAEYSLQLFHDFDEASDYACTWFDKEIKDVFNFDIYNFEFNAIDGYQIYEAENADILALKLEKLTDCHQQAFKDFLSIENFDLKNVIVGSQKPYRNVYCKVLENIYVPESYLEKIYSSRFVRQFYTHSEIQGFMSRWLGRPAGSSISSSNLTESVKTLSEPRRTENHTVNREEQSNQNAFYAPPPLTSSVAGCKVEKLPKISLVTPSYNQGRYLEECIESVLSQGYPCLEYIIMDGGSTDNSIEVIKKCEKYLTYWQSIDDGGQYVALNHGFAKTSGDIMTWLNSDHKFQPNAFYMVAAIFQHRKDVEWITGLSNTFNEGGDQLWICEYVNRYSRSNYLHKEYDKPWIQQEGTFWRRSLWEISGAYLDTELQFAADLELWTRFFRFSSLYSADVLLAGFRHQPNSKTSLFLEKYLQEADWVLEKKIKLFKEGSSEPILPSPVPIEFEETKEAFSLFKQVDPNFASTLSRPESKRTLKSGHEAALEFYKQCKKQNPGDHKVRNSLGMLFYQIGNAQRAIEEFIAALRINPHYPDAVINLGDVLIRINEAHKAEKLYASFLAANPQKRDFLNKYARSIDILKVNETRHDK